MFEQIKNKRNDCIVNFILTLLGFTKQQRVLFRSLRWFELSTNWADEVFIMPELSGLIKQLMIWWQPSAARNYELLFNHLLVNLTWSSVLCIYRQLSKTQKKSVLIDKLKSVAPSCKICHRCLVGENHHHNIRQRRLETNGRTKHGFFLMAFSSDTNIIHVKHLTAATKFMIVELNWWTKTSLLCSAESQRVLKVCLMRLLSHYLKLSNKDDTSLKKAQKCVCFRSIIRTQFSLPVNVLARYIML